MDASQPKCPTFSSLMSVISLLMSQSFWEQFYSIDVIAGVREFRGQTYFCVGKGTKPVFLRDHSTGSKYLNVNSKSGKIGIK